MTVKEITELRKSGHLEEALAAAESEFSNRQDSYNAGALFWCLKDLYPRQERQQAIETVGRMKLLNEEYGAGNEFMNKALAAAEKLLLPNYRLLREALDKARNNGNGIQYYEEIAQIYDGDGLEPELYPDFGWLIYYAIKDTPVQNAYARKVLLSRYLKLKLPTPGLLHSMILKEAVKVERNTPLQFRIRDFIRLWGLENLRDDDWEQHETDGGNQLMSLVEQLISVYAKELRTDKVVAPAEFAELVNKAEEKYPKSQNLPYSKASVLISQGKRDEAVGYYRDLILRFPSKLYLWQQTADLIDEVDTQLGLLSKALMSGGDEQFLGGMRLNMAKLLVQKGELAHARYELDRYSDLYRAKGWSLKGDYWTLSNSVGAVDAASDNSEIYSVYSRKADEFIYSQIPEQTAVKVAEKQIDDKKRPGRKFPVWILRTKDGILRLKKPTKFGLARGLKNGTVFSVRLQDEKIVWIKLFDNVPKTEWLKEMEGEIKLRTDRNGRPFAIISGIYIGSMLLKSVEDGTHVRILAVRQDDGRWSAVSLVPMY